jgi:hypothetical protein
MTWGLLVFLLQIAAGLLWLLPGIYLIPRIVRAWGPEPTRGTALSAPVGFLAWLQVGFTIRWQVWPDTRQVMETGELITWAALYAFSGFLAVWFFHGARQMRGG